MFNKITLTLFALSVLSLSACADISGTQGQAMSPEETGIISPDDNAGQ